MTNRIAPARAASASVSLPPAVTAPQQARTGGDAVATAGPRKLWLQLASGPNVAALPAEFTKLKNRNEELFEGISPYVVQDGARARLLIGPFRNDKEATIFMEDLASVRIDAFTWTSQPGQAVRKIPSE